MDKDKINRIKSRSTGVDNVTPAPDPSATITTDRGEEFTVAEIEHSKRIYKSKTPKGDLSWYVKWFSSVCVLFAMSMRGIEHLAQYDLMLSLVGVMGWCWVGIMWKDRALILLNGTGILLLLSTLLREYVFVVS